MPEKPRKLAKKSPTKSARPRAKRTASDVGAETSALAERPLPETFDTDEEPRGRAQIGAAHPYDEIDDEPETDTETTDVQTGLRVRRDEGQNT